MYWTRPSPVLGEYHVVSTGAEIFLTQSVLEKPSAVAPSELLHLLSVPRYCPSQMRFGFHRYQVLSSFHIPMNDRRDVCRFYLLFLWLEHRYSFLLASGLKPYKSPSAYIYMYELLYGLNPARVPL